MAARKVTIRSVSAGSVFKVATLLALLGFIAWMAASALVYYALERAGVVESVNSLIGGVGGDQVVDMKLAMSAAGLLGLVGVVFMSIMAPLTAILYNAVADLVGGIRYTMSNRAR
ncbi:DUF3566 domain-containing protein [Corynebacterium lujinxingii]|uniref:DUF3566 domain-containing protein n=1 Tax=Corynebacterium lujinxingii TaxID=2763010 RepID=A0A7H0JYX5_9CORY|nr:DUF3566 domain-containing protein [Corynebacterium lujinxingii]MBC3179222.1 DUF3566 domain-containing protein [Corynebacterium lujinxingii]NNO10098.1 DUF3566 domain-containing protein [Corynebacterium lujinxingii]QNP90241.1 DUF3566 domain-containing protein [Corynebacterium lujinxingii]